MGPITRKLLCETRLLGKFISKKRDDILIRIILGTPILMINIILTIFLRNESAGLFFDNYLGHGELIMYYCKTY